MLVLEILGIFLVCAIVLGIPMFLIVYPILALIMKGINKAEAKKKAREEITLAEWMEAAKARQEKEIEEEKERYKRFFEVAKEYGYKFEI